MDYQFIISERQGAVALITLNRPEKLNALSFPLMEELDHALTGYEADDDIKAVILTGAGERAFSAGADIHEMAGPIVGGIGPAQRHPRPHQLAYRQLYEAADRRDQRPRLWRRGALVLLARPAHRLREDAVPLSRGQLRPGQLDLVLAGPGRHPESQGIAVHRPRRRGRRGRAHRARQPGRARRQADRDRRSRWAR